MDGGMSECFHEAKHDGMIYFSFYMFTHFAYPVDIYRTIKNPVMGGHHGIARRLWSMERVVSRTRRGGKMKEMEQERQDI